MGECFFWYRPTRVVPDQRPLNGRCCLSLSSPLQSPYSRLRRRAAVVCRSSWRLCSAPCMRPATIESRAGGADLSKRGLISRTRNSLHRCGDCVRVRSMVNIARLTIWSIYCSRGGGEGRADSLIVAPFIGAA